MAAQVPGEGGLIKAVRRQHRYKFRNTVHRCHITAGPTERLDVRQAAFGTAGRITLRQCVTGVGPHRLPLGADAGQAGGGCKRT